MSPRVLLTDDEANIRRMVAALLESEGFETAEAANGTAALAAVERDPPDAVLLDLMMPGGPDGLATLEQLKRVAPDLPVVMMSGKANLTDAVRATKLGAFQFLEKPLTPEGVLTTLRAALELSRTLAENRRLHEALGHADPLVGVSKAMDELRGLIARVGPTEARVLITGESGTGKELVARALHRHSPRAAGPFVAINTAAIPKDLLESELFGHERGAFTGAQSSRRGRFEQAEGGTLFLDEIGDMPPDLQVRLLRVLADGEYYRVGGHAPLKASVRVIAATHQNLEDRVRQGLFREDLLHRLNVVRLRLPPLRERQEDIAPLARHFLAKSARELAVEPKLMSDAALKLLASFAFPGNVRQLENVCHWLTVMAPGQRIEAADLPPEVRDTSGATASGEASWQHVLDRELAQALARGEKSVGDRLEKEFEKTLILRALAHTGGHRMEAAQWLGWGRNTLTRKIQELGLEPELRKGGVS